MTRLSYVKKAILTAACIALCVVLPMAFHAIPNAGNIYCPMHMPVLLCGLVCGWPFGLLCGVAGPVLSSLFTGMPSMAYLPSMVIELAAYGFVAGIMMRIVHTKMLLADLYISLAAALLAGRIVAGASRALIFAPGSYSMAAWAASYFVTALPGLVIQLALLPAIAFALEKARLIPVRYPKMAG
ncbi:MAG: ECF transporter S component [Lachnospiraceae bacterium]|nr:ECF transporter S component [Lachnospiraceae bacterium]